MGEQGGIGSKSQDFEGTSFTDAPLEQVTTWHSLTEGRQAVVAHEGVDADAEHVGDPPEAGHRRVGVDPAGRDPDAGDDDHAEEGRPPHQGRQHLEVLGLGHVEEGEGTDHQGEARQEHPVRVQTGQVGGRASGAMSKIKTNYKSTQLG